jgi:ABC-type transport system involved in cytochrome c biogenesis permease subunit
MMNRIGKRLVGLVLAGACGAFMPAFATGEQKSPGTGPAYELLGKVAVLHEGRIKPLDTVAREEVKQIHGRETIKLHDPSEEIDKIIEPEGAPKPAVERPVQSWGPVGAFLDWIVVPEFWDDQPFILVDSLPLRRQLMSETITKRLKAIAEKSTTPADEKPLLEKLAAEKEPAQAALAQLARSSKLPIEDRKTIAELAAKLTEEHKWMTPRELDECRLSHDGEMHSFLDWASELQNLQKQFDANPKAGRRLLPAEKRAVEVAMRLGTYQAYSGDRVQAAGLVLIMPRPSNTTYLADTARAVKEARAMQDSREKLGPESMALFKLDELKAFSTFWNNIPLDERKVPTEDPKFDDRFTAWLRDNSVWVPLKVFLKSKPAELVEAGYPESQTKAFLDAYHALEQAESSSTGHLSPDVAALFLKTSRELGEAVNPTRYPTVAMIERETHFNAMSPFWLAPAGYGAGVALLVISLAIGTLTGKPPQKSAAGATAYGLGLAALASGIGLEIYGFYLRVMITGWAPVTNMYETVIWVALVAAVLASVLEMIYRKVFIALAGSAVGLLGTFTAASVSLLDPSIRSLQPVLRSNFWLATHVLCEVSSYAAFALAWMLGLIATTYYLTATYRRSPRFLELALPLVIGLPLVLFGGVGLAACYGMFGPQWMPAESAGSSGVQSLLSGDILFYVCGAIALAGEMITLTGLLALGGEVMNRMTFKPEAQLETAEEKHSMVKLDARGRAMQRTISNVKPLSNFVYRAMQVGVLLIAGGTILGGVWADYSWGRFWGWDPKEVWALITLLVYLVPLHGRFAGWVSTFGLVAASVICFNSVIMAWYGVNFVLGVGLHSYGFVEGGSQGMMLVILLGLLALPFGAGWRRHLGQHAVVEAESGAFSKIGSVDSGSIRKGNTRVTGAPAGP